MAHLVVGAGIMGLCTAWALTRRGEKVVVIEQGPLPNPLASSVDDHRLIRYPYGDARGYCRLVHDAYAGWDQLWGDLGTKLQAETGTLILGRAGDEWPLQSCQILAEEGIAYEDLSVAQAATRFKHLNTEDCSRIVYLPSGGILMARHIVQAIADWLRQAGSVILEHAKVVSLDPATPSVRLGDGQVISGESLTLATGPWLGDLLPTFALRSQPSRQVIVYAEAGPAVMGEWQQSPMVLEIGNGAGFYAVPPRRAPDGSALGLKLGDHSFSLKGHPDRDRTPTNEEAKEIFGFCAPRLMHADQYKLGVAKSCFYDVAAEERFIVERVAPQTIALGGFSGHGFKFAAWLGLAIAEVLVGGADFNRLRDRASGQGA